MTAPAPTAAGPVEAYPEFLDCLAAADEYAATDVALRLLEEGVPAERVLLDLIAPAQEQVGRWWQRNVWSVAQEHAATHVSERAVAAVAAHTRVRPHLGRVVVSCMDGEWHALPARLVGEVLRLRGWDVAFLGASVPAAHLVSYLHRDDAHAVALACALPMRLPDAHRMIEACRRADVPILVGGRGFGPDGRWARRLGVHWAGDATAAADLLADERRLHRPPSEDLDHLADDEYPGLVKSRADLIDTGLRDLTARVPSMADYTTAQFDSTVSDLGHIVDFLTAAVYVDDDALFTSFIAWMVEVLDSRKVPPHTLDRVLDVYAETLHDFPRAHRFLHAGRAAVRS
ncbi:cobalamin B12-binding domain-containing protein [Polymorphospora sp. NPDC051019]|uniref:cobalamin B12-binding domain-containing protein n=1 Tax=Polymorphospora sp. NPDC051019 TaxID=3155725 RepID=UPI0034478770